jgi:hypothetical protein
MVKRKGPASPTSTAFLRAHLLDMISVDFFVETIRNQVLHVVAFERAALQGRDKDSSLFH